VKIPTLSRVAVSESLTKETRAPQEYPSTTVFQTSSVHMVHPHFAGGATVGAAIGATVGVTVGEDVCGVVGDDVGTDIGADVGADVGGGVGDSVGELVSASQVQVQISGNSSVTKRQAPASSSGPLLMPTLWSVATSESRAKEILPPQVYPSAKVFQTDSVQDSHPHRGEAGVGAGSWTGAGVGGCTTGPPPFSVLKTVLTPYIL